MLKKLSLLIILMLGIIASSWGQFIIKGQVTDTTIINDVAMTSIVVIGAQDSIIKTFSRTDDQGNFQLEVKEKGPYILIASHPVFAIYTEHFEVAQPTTVLENIGLVTKSDLMETVFFTDARAIMIKGDTTIYTADSFNVRQYATVDELLKKLPGIEVSKDGKITAYGKEVQKMFVDGEEFFSDDPSVVAKTLQASSIDKVKVYDDKSEAAKNTGIDDGEQIKTINLTLKDDAKKGIMGSLYAGASPQGYHEYSAKIQSFRKKQKVAVYYNGGNTNSDMMNWNDRSIYGGSSGITMDEDGNFSMESYDDYNETNGLPRKQSAGANYTNKFFNDKLNFNLSYGFNSNGLNAKKTSSTEYTMPDTQYVNNYSNTSKSLNVGHRINTRNIIQIDSNKTLTINGLYRNRKGEQESEGISSYLDRQGNIMSNSTTNNYKESNSDNYSVDFNYNQKLLKKGRSFSVGARYSEEKSNSDIKFNSSNRLIALDSTIVFNQIKKDITNSKNYSANASYTEPLYKNKLFLGLTYNFGRNENSKDLATYDENGITGPVYNSLYSNDYSFNTTSHSGGFNLSYNEKKMKSSIGLRASTTQFEQINRIHEILNRNYSAFNLFPRASLRYELKSNTSLSFNYNGNTTQPTIDQLQPLVVNTDPTNIRIGNDDLKQSFSNRFNTSFHSYSVLKSSYYYLSLGYTNKINPINLAQSLDGKGIRTYQYINTKNSNDFNLYGHYSNKLIEYLRLGIGANGSYGTNYTINNGLESKNSFYNISPNASLSLEKDTTINLSLNFSPTYYNNSSSINKSLENSYWMYRTSLDLDIQLPYNFIFKTDISWNARPKLNENVEGTNVMLWNASISRTFLKDRSLKASIYCYDILNQNVGFNFYQSGVSTNQSSWNVIQQYFMLKLTWNFNTMVKGVKNSDDDDVIFVN